MLSLLVVLLTLLSGNLVDASFREINIGRESIPSIRGIEYLDHKTTASTCGPVYVEPGTEAFIEISIEAISVEKNIKDPEQLEIPTLVVSLTDKMRFQSDLAWSQYNPEALFEVYDYEDGESNNYDRSENFFDKSKNKFKVTVEGEPLDSLAYFNGALSKSKPVKFPVPTTDVYCVFTVPHKANIKSVSIAVVYKNSYGYLAFPSYAFLQELKLALVLVFIEAALIFWSIYKSTIQSSSNLSVVSRTVIFFIFTPFFSLILIETVSLGLRNVSEPRRLGGLYFFLKSVIHFARKIFYIYIDYWILLFAMGYGVIYYDKNAPGNHKIFPSRLASFAKILLLSNISIFIVNNLVSALLRTDFAADVPDAFSKLNPDVDYSFIYTLHDFCRFLLGIFPAVWFGSVFYHFKESLALVNSPLKTKFKLSIILTLTFEIISVLLMLIYSYVNSAKSPAKMGLLRESYVAESKACFDTGQLKAIFWSQDANIQLLILVFLLFWVRDNSGLGVKHPIQDYELANREA